MRVFAWRLADELGNSGVDGRCRSSWDAVVGVASTRFWEEAAMARELGGVEVGEGRENVGRRGG